MQSISDTSYKTNFTCASFPVDSKDSPQYSAIKSYISVNSLLNYDGMDVKRISLSTDLCSIPVLEHCSIFTFYSTEEFLANH